MSIKNMRNVLHCRKFHNNICINMYKFNFVNKRITHFFENKNFVQTWPSSQKGMVTIWNEFQLNNVFCINTTYTSLFNNFDILFQFASRDKKNELESNLCCYLGFPINQHDFIQKGIQHTDDHYATGTYEAVCERYGVKKLEREDEHMLEKEFGSVFFIKDVPESVESFWYNCAILGGEKTIYSSERSKDFERSNDFKRSKDFECWKESDRFCGVISMKNMIIAMDKYGLIPPEKPPRQSGVYIDNKRYEMPLL